MSKNDNSHKRLKAPWQLAAEHDERVSRRENTIILYVQGSHAVYRPAQILKLIHAAKGEVIDTYTFKNSGREQYKVKIKEGNVEALFLGYPVLDISPERFRKTTNLGMKAFLPSQ